MMIENFKIKQIEDLSILKTFRCGVEIMDQFIQTGLSDCVLSHLCVPYGCYDSKGQLLAFFALSFDALDLDSDDKEDLRQGFASVGIPDLPAGYDMFWEKSRYPAMEITYLAVSTEFQHNGLGFAILDAIAEKARSQTMAGCQFLTVNALHLPEYSAVGFYSSFGFSRYGNITVVSDIVPMFYTLYTEEDDFIE